MALTKIAARDAAAQELEEREGGAPSAARGVRRRWLSAAVGLAIAMALAWSGRHRLLAVAGHVLVSEDAIAAADAIVVSMGGENAAAVEAGQLYEQRIAPLILLPVWNEDGVEDELRKLGFPRYAPPGILPSILERSGVPDSAIQNLPGIVDGTDTEVAAIAAFARQRQLASVLFLTSRPHTARARWLLTRQLPPGTRLYVRSPRTDKFSPDAWWRSRNESREVALEYLRWFNILVLRDQWSR